MNRKMNRGLIGILVLGMVVLVLATVGVQVVGAETAQRWYLTGDIKPADAPIANDGIDTHTRDALLYKSEAIGTWGGTQVSLPSDNVAWFYADTGAECDLGFGEYAWKTFIRTEEIEEDEVGHNLTVEICKLDSEGTITILANHSETLTAALAYTLWEINCEDNGSTYQDFSTGDWLAIKLSWDCTTDSLLIYYKAEDGKDSYIQSPASDPGYPVPELSTLILFSVGLIVLAGYVLLTKRRR